MGHDKGFFRMGLTCTIGWPSKERSVVFRGHSLTLAPETEELAPSAVVKVGEGLTQEEARRLIQEFLSGLAWVERGSIAETFSVFCSGPSPSLRVGKGTAGMVSDAPIEYVPDPRDPTDFLLKG